MGRDHRGGNGAAMGTQVTRKLWGRACPASIRNVAACLMKLIISETIEGNSQISTSDRNEGPQLGIFLWGAVMIVFWISIGIWWWLS